MLTTIFKRLRLAFAASLLASAVAAQAAAPAGLSTAKPIYVGHSLINNEVPAIVKAMALSRGKTIRSAVQWIVGSPIAFNWLNCRQSLFTGQFPPPAFACDEIDRGTDIGPYDSLIVTQANNPIIYPPDPEYVGSTPQDYDDFLNLFLSRNASGRAFFYTAWENQGSEWHEGAEWTTRIAPELAKYERIAHLIEDQERLRGRSIVVNVIPVNLALRDLILAAESGAFPGITNRSQLFVDVVHLSPLGYYVAAAVVYASLFEQSPQGATARVAGDYGQDIVNLDPDLAARIQSFAWTTVANYRGWSPASVTRPRAPTNLIVR